jgi:hypothetical protein
MGLTGGVKEEIQQRPRFFGLGALTDSVDLDLNAPNTLHLDLASQLYSLTFKCFSWDMLVTKAASLIKRKCTPQTVGVYITLDNSSAVPKNKEIEQEKRNSSSGSKDSTISTKLHYFEPANRHLLAGLSLNEREEFFKMAAADRRTKGKLIDFIVAVIITATYDDPIFANLKELVVDGINARCIEITEKSGYIIPHTQARTPNNFIDVTAVRDLIRKETPDKSQWTQALESYCLRVVVDCSKQKAPGIRISLEVEPPMGEGDVKVGRNIIDAKKKFGEEILVIVQNPDTDFIVVLISLIPRLISPTNPSVKTSILLDLTPLTSKSKEKQFIDIVSMWRTLNLEMNTDYTGIKYSSYYFCLLNIIGGTDFVDKPYGIGLPVIWKFAFEAGFSIFKDPSKAIVFKETKDGQVTTEIPYEALFEFMYNLEAFKKRESKKESRQEPFNLLPVPSTSKRTNLQLFRLNISQLGAWFRRIQWNLEYWLNSGSVGYIPPDPLKVGSDSKSVWGWLVGSDSKVAVADSVSKDDVALHRSPISSIGFVTKRRKVESQ